jgi:hypothetical protein
MYRKFDVTGNLLFAQYFFFDEVNTALIWNERAETARSGVRVPRQAGGGHREVLLVVLRGRRSRWFDVACADRSKIPRLGRAHTAYTHALGVLRKHPLCSMASYWSSSTIHVDHMRTLRDKNWNLYQLWFQSNIGILHQINPINSMNERA